MSATETEQRGKVVRASGSVVEASNLPDVQMHEVVEVGPHRLVGEIIRMARDVVTIQVYEHMTGLRPGAEVYPTGGPLRLSLGPGLLGNIFDGIQRPLSKLTEQSGSFIEPGQEAEALPSEKGWEFRPCVEEGDELPGGEVFGVVQETEAIEHRLLVPPERSGEVVEMQPEGSYRLRDTLCILENEHGRTELNMVHQWPTRQPRPFQQRLLGDRPLITGQRVIDTFFPIAEGGTSAIPGDFGTGKTVLQHSLAKWAEADIVIYVGCGERGNEMTDILREFPELEDPRTGRSVMERTVLIANTSNMPVAAREISIYTGITVAEYYRDMGYRVALMADSTSRWAEALREISSRLEEMPAEEGFPAYLPSSLAEFYERAGRVRTLKGDEGSVSVIGAVSPPGGDFSEPVTEHTKRFTRCFWALDRDLAHARHYPAVSWMDSYSEYLSDIQDWWETKDAEWPQLRKEALDVLHEEDRLQEIVKLVGPDVLPDSQRLTLTTASLLKNGFLQQNALDPVDTYCTPEKQLLLLRAFVVFHRKARQLVEQGVPIARIREADVLRALPRAKSSIKNEDQDALKELIREVESQLEDLRSESQ